jgi:multiple sugar transport system permease protein
MWLYNEKLAIPIIAISSVIKGIGMNMIIFLAALKSVPATYYEAGELEGATGLHKLWHITLPLISPTLFLNLVMSIILSLRVFGMVNTMTKGGPGVSSYVLVYYIFIEAFTKMKFGNASAASVIMFTVIMIITVIQWKLRKRWVYYET